MANISPGYFCVNHLTSAEGYNMAVAMSRSSVQKCFPLNSSRPGKSNSVFMFEFFLAKIFIHGFIWF